MIAALLARWRPSTEAEASTPASADVDPVLAAAKRGAPEAIGVLYDRHHEVVRRFARRLLGDATAAEDLVQDVFLALPSALQRYRGEGSLRSFLLSIAANQARHHVRSAMRKRRALEQLALEPVSAPPSPELYSERHGLARRLREALDALPLEQRTAIVLCDLEEHTSTEAAVILQIPEGTVRTRLFHARRKLREALTAEQAP